VNRGRLIAVVAGAAVLAGAVFMLRSEVQAPVPPAVAPDGQRITAYHDPALVTPPKSPSVRPRQPGRLHTDARRDGALVSWPPAPYGFEVRWGSAGTEPARTAPANVRYVATPSTSLSGLARGRYRVEVRSVDEVGRRSEPSTAEVEVSGEAPPWQRGLGFVEDFTSGAGLGADRWRVADLVRQCIPREGERGPIVLGGQCGGMLRPISPLVLSGPDPAGVRGRVVVVADAPPPPPPRPRNLDGVIGVPQEGYGGPEDLTIAVAPPPLPAPTAFASIQLRVSSHGVFLDIFDGTANEPPVEHRLDAPPPDGPGALHRWELVFTTDQVRVQRDGEPIGSVEHRPSWREADVSVSASVSDDSGSTVPDGVRVGLVGLTGPAPDGRAVELTELNKGTDVPGTVQRFMIKAAPTVRAARVTGRAIDPTTVDGRPPVQPDLVAEVDGRRVQLWRQPAGYPEGAGFWFAVDLPAQLLKPQVTLTLRAANGATFAAYGVELELTHEPGTVLDVPQPRVEQPARPSLVQPELVVRHGEQVVSSGQPAPRGPLEVEVRLDAVSAQTAGGGLVGWVAVRAELDDRRILDFPTAADGPAVAGTYRFMLDTTTVPAGAPALVVSLIPDRPGIAYGSDRFIVRLDG
jgi:hypothetical protein